MKRATTARKLWVTILLTLVLLSCQTWPPLVQAGGIVISKAKEQGQNYVLLQLELSLTPGIGAEGYSKVFSLIAPFSYNHVQLSYRARLTEAFSGGNLALWQTRDQDGVPIHVPLIVQKVVNHGFAQFAAPLTTITELRVDVESTGNGEMEVILLLRKVD